MWLSRQPRSPAVLMLEGSPVIVFAVQAKEAVVGTLGKGQRHRAEGL